jgi:hypothetical protein
MEFNHLKNVDFAFTFTNDSANEAEEASTLFESMFARSIQVS